MAYKTRGLGPCECDGDFESHAVMGVSGDGERSLLRMRGISKRFGATVALEDVSLDVVPGRVTALIGENGAGKTTLMRILSGAERPDGGEMQFDGRAYRPAGPHAARRAGVAMIYQELNLALDLSVEDNMMLGLENSIAGVLQRRRQRERVREALTLLGHPRLNVAAPVRRLSNAERQLVEIARALVHDAKMIVFDEPTSSLTRADVEHLFEVIRRLRAEGLGIVYISHFLEEVREVCDRYAVLRDGRSVGQGELTEIDSAGIVSLMAGRTVQELFPRVPHEPGEEVVRVESLSGGKSPRGVSLSLRRGEIFGLAGLVGAGRTELLRCLYALDDVRSGKLSVAGNDVRSTVRRRIRAGFGFVSEDRKHEGLAQSRSIEDNLTYSRLSPYRRWGVLRLGERTRAAEHWMRTMQVKASSPKQPVSDLSGGNQQKVAIGRVLHQNADILLLDEPTRGIDVGTKAEIYRLMGEAAAAGRCVIFVSSYLTELLEVCDRIGVMCRGELRDVRDAGDWTPELMLQAAVGETVVAEAGMIDRQTDAAARGNRS